MAQTKTSETKSKKPATRFGKHRSPAAMTAHKHAGHRRHTSASPRAASTSGIAYTSEFGNSTASTGGDGKAKERERGRQRKGDQQRATRQFIAGIGDHPSANERLDRHINVSPTAGTPYFAKTSSGIGAGQHAA